MLRKSGQKIRAVLLDFLKSKKMNELTAAYTLWTRSTACWRRFRTKDGSEFIQQITAYTKIKSYSLTTEAKKSRIKSNLLSGMCRRDRNFSAKSKSKIK